MSKRQGQRLFHGTIAIEAADRLLRTAGFDACKGAPSVAWCKLDSDSQLRRVEARWPGGWRARLVLHKDGCSTLRCVKQVARVRVRTEA